MRKPSIAHGSGSEVDKGQAILATTGASNLSTTRRLPEEEVRWVSGARNVRFRKNLGE